jgi:hypothetical protein
MKAMVYAWKAAETTGKPSRSSVLSRPANRSMAAQSARKASASTRSPSQPVGGWTSGSSRLAMASTSAAEPHTLAGSPPCLEPESAAMRIAFTRRESAACRSPLPRSLDSSDRPTAFVRYSYAPELA